MPSKWLLLTCAAAAVVGARADVDCATMKCDESVKKEEAFYAEQLKCSEQPEKLSDIRKKIREYSESDMKTEHSPYDRSSLIQEEHDAEDILAACEELKVRSKSFLDAEDKGKIVAQLIALRAAGGEPEHETVYADNIELRKEKAKMLTELKTKVKKKKAEAAAEAAAATTTAATAAATTAAASTTTQPMSH